MIVLFPFEKDLYSKYGMQVDYVGHPLIDEIVIGHGPMEVLKAVGLSAGKTTIGLMPGSRLKEVERHLPLMLEAAKILFQKNKQHQFLLLKSSSIPLKLIESIIQRQCEPSFQCHCEPEGRSNLLQELQIRIYDGPAYDGINAMDAALVASGTATLECALLKKPMVIIYKTSWLTYFLAKALIKIPYIGLVNIVAGKKIVEELIQTEADAKSVANGLESALHNQTLVEEYSAVKTSLGQPGASLRAAKVVLEIVS
jgi:lipid-A-disaccharide synthase